MLGFSANTIWFPGLSWRRDWSMAKISLYCNTYTRYEDEYRHARMLRSKRNSLSLPLVHPNSEWDVGLREREREFRRLTRFQPAFPSPANLPLVISYRCPLVRR